MKYSFALPDKVLDQNEAQGTIVAVQYFEPLLRNSRIFNELKELIQECCEAIEHLNNCIDKLNKFELKASTSIIE